MTSIQPMGKRLVCFAVRRRQKMMGSSLFRGDSNRGMFTRAEDIFVVAQGPEVENKFEKGEHVLISDAFELEPYDLKLWEFNESDPAFAKCAKLAEETSGTVETVIVHENSLLGVVTGEFFQDQIGLY